MAHSPAIGPSIDLRQNGLHDLAHVGHCVRAAFLDGGGNEGVEFRKLFTNHFHITTSGFFSDPAMLCCLQEMGADRIMFAIDYPFVPNDPGPVWMERLMLNEEDKDKILHGNAEKLLKL